MNGHDRRDFLKVLSAGASPPGAAVGIRADDRSDQEPTPAVRDPRYREWSRSRSAEAKRLGLLLRRHPLHAQPLAVADAAQRPDLSTAAAASAAAASAAAVAAARPKPTASASGSFTAASGASPAARSSRPTRSSASPASRPRSRGRARSRRRPTSGSRRSRSTTSSGRCRSRRTRGRSRSRRRSSCCAASPARSRRRPASSSPTRPPASSTSGSILATSEGSYIEQVFHFSNCSASATARTGTQVKTRNYERLPARGYEFLVKCDLPGPGRAHRRRSGRALEGQARRPGPQGPDPDAVASGAHDSRDRRARRPSSIASPATKRTTPAPAS